MIYHSLRLLELPLIVMADEGRPSRLPLMKSGKNPAGD
jgi:hypothetical protein